MRRRGGLLLLEVLVALALLAGVVVSFLVANAHAIHEHAVASERCVAADLARDLLTRWRLETQIPRDETEGTFDGSAGWSWALAVRPLLIEQAGAMMAMTLEIRHADGDGGQRVIEAYTWLREPAEDDTHGTRD